MNPTISLPRHNSNASNFGGVSASRRQTSIRMPRFFKRLFKFPSMDFEMAVWEMTSLIIAPKKVFRSVYYQKRESEAVGYQTFQRSNMHRNEKHMASTGSVLYLPPVLLPSLDSTSMGACIRRRRLADDQDRTCFHIWPLFSVITSGFDSDVLFGGQISGTWSCRTSRQE